MSQPSSFEEPKYLKGIDDPHDSHEEEETEHPDERWLVSYADMMTLLFGLFVMLYSMANKFEQVQSSAAKEFSKPVAKKPEITQVEYEKLKSQLDASHLTIANLQNNILSSEENSKKDKNEIKIAQQKLDELQSTLTAQTAELATTKGSLSQTSAKIDDSTSLMQKVRLLENEKKVLDEKLVSSAQKNKQLQTELTQKAPVRADNHEAELQNLTSQKTALEKRVSDQAAQIQQLEKQSARAAGGAFAAVVISWPTQNHDIDLIVTDPEGKSYNYKHRAFDQHPGKFVLDTRRGPGAEMWQTDRILPGIYQIKYLFYNTYGNNDPAPVSGSIYSQGGIFDLPKVELNFNTKREQTFKLKISDKGEVQIVP
jgi:flagellar motor protein MotB